jgi:hypothetical protein
MLAELAEVGSGAVIAQLDLAGLAALVAIERAFAPRCLLNSPRSAVAR